MKRHTLLFLFASVSLCALTLGAQGEERLITSPGKYTGKDGRLSVEINLPDPEHINFKVEWTVRETNEVGHIIKHSWAKGFYTPPLPVAEVWASYMARSDKLWFYIMRIPNVALRLLLESGFFTSPFPVARERWAFCMVGNDELWLYDGRKFFKYFKGTSTGIGPSGCPVPNLGDMAPKTLRLWVSKGTRSNR